MAKGLEEKDLESLVTDLVRGALDINQLNVDKAKQKEAFLKALVKRPHLLSKVNKDNEGRLFAVALKEKPEYFVYLDRAQYTNELAQIYLYARLNGKVKRENDSILVSRSLDERIVFTVSYLTPEEDELYYLDKELQVPISLRSDLVLTLKLDDAVAMINKLDVQITQLGEETIKSAISGLIANQYKSYLNNYINEKQVGYYSLCTSLTEIEEGFAKRAADVFSPYGITVSGFAIKGIAIPKDIQTKLEDQAFKLRRRRAEVEADAEFERLSLQTYEAKLAIHAKYPDAELTLTEYEKDLALKRYLTKIGRRSDDTVDRSIKIGRSPLKSDSDIAKSDDYEPEIPKKRNVFRICYIALAAIASLISIISLSSNVGNGLIALGVSILVLGVIAAFNTERFSNDKPEEATDTVTVKNDPVVAPAIESEEQ